MTSIESAERYIGRRLDQVERDIVSIDHYAPESFDSDWSESKKDCLLIMACQSEMIRTYLKCNAAFSRDYNVHIVNVATALQMGLVQNVPDIISELYLNADLVFGHVFISGPYNNLNASSIPGKTTRECVWFCPPNNNAFWPITNMWDSPELKYAAMDGETKSVVWKELQDGTFDPHFNERYQNEMQWMSDRERHFDVKLAPFIDQNFRDVKLFFTYNHPTSNLIAWIGPELLRVIGYSLEGIGEILSHSPDKYGDLNAFPETQYEFNHYKLRYPMRWNNAFGGLDFYRKLIMGSEVLSD